MSFKYRESVLKELARHGVIPLNDTPPQLIHDFVSELHRLEIRRLRQQMLEGKIKKKDYANTVEALRKRYPVLTLPARFWTEEQ